jgi:hypothetical protein
MRVVRTTHGLDVDRGLHVNAREAIGDLDERELPRLSAVVHR